ncbi:MAG: antibiotic biosynthesis monooxygenase [Candidatus Promineifilaceae bacterium]|nr:antibiotic biosynthesis monooxygenase [Candidatus Promineifilaceae bacterium]
MYANITVQQVKKDRMEEAAHAWQELLSTERPEGLKRAYYVHDVESGESVVFGLWESEAVAKAFESSGEYQQKVGELGEHFRGSPSRKVYEVAARVGE